MRLKACSIDLEVVVVMEVVCAHLGLDPAKLSDPSRQQQICQARALICQLTVRELKISGVDVARRMNIDRSSVSQAVGRIQADPALKNMKKALFDNLHSED